METLLSTERLLTESADICHDKKLAKELAIAWLSVASSRLLKQALPGDNFLNFMENGLLFIPDSNGGAKWEFLKKSFVSSQNALIKNVLP